MMRNIEALSAGRGREPGSADSPRSLTALQFFGSDPNASCFWCVPLYVLEPDKKKAAPCENRPFPIVYSRRLVSSGCQNGRPAEAG